jgi:mono/diheme cytochrome c family protein
MTMKKPLKITLYTVGTLLMIAALAVAVLLWNSHRKINRVVDVAVAAVPYVDLTNAASATEALARGKYLYEARGCVECHGANGAGRTVIDDPMGLFVHGANLTTGKSSAVLHYTERDWVRAIRHGVKPDGRPAFIMPSQDYNRFTDGDLADMVAYIRALPPAEGTGTEIRLPLLVKLVHGAGILKDAAEQIDHSAPPSTPVPVAATVEHGRYVAQTCIGCHGAKLEGGPIAGAPPDWPPAANLNGDQAGPMARYQSLDQFKTMLRTAKRPDGSKVNSAMPFEALKLTNDTDIEAMFKYFKSLGGVEKNG